MSPAINEVTAAIRALGQVDCETVAQIFSTLAAQMKQSGFADVDLDMMDEIRGFVCGETA
jgi:hypothetical protein